MNNNAPLYDGIIESAKAEAEGILKKGNEEIAELKESYKTKILDAKKHEEYLTSQKLKEIRLTRENYMKNMERSHQGEELKNLKKYSQKALFEEMAKKVGTREYEKAVIYWIAEGAIALDADKVRVATSKKETITDKMIEKAVSIVEKVVSRKVEIQIDKKPLSTQGVVVSTIDGKIAYNNSINVRFMRLRADFERVLEGTL